MMSDDLVSRLSETLDEAERVAVAAQALCWEARGDCVIVDDGNPDTPLVARMRSQGNRVHIARWDPQAVLRLVAAHRKLVAKCEIWLDDSELAFYAQDLLLVLAGGWGLS